MIPTYPEIESCTVPHFPVEIGHYISTQIPEDMILSLSWQEVRAGVLSREMR